MPGQPCIVCERPDRAEIELAMLRHDAGMRSLALRFGNVSHASLRRHMLNHLGVTVAQSLEMRMTLSADNLLAKLSALDERTMKLLDTAERTGQLRTALAAIHESRANIDGYARLIALGTLLQANTAQSAQPAQSALPTLPTQSMRDILKILIASGAATAKDDDPDEHDEKDEKDEHEENDHERERPDSAG